MNRINITTEKFLRLRPLKPGIVHTKKNLVYKYSPLSEETMRYLDKYKNEKITSHISMAKALLYQRGIYFGYAMEYYKLTSLFDEIKKGSIELYPYFSKLLLYLERLEEMGILYWDFHFGNIKVDERNEPFLLDTDSIDLFAPKDLFQSQREYLINFILNAYLGDNRTLNKYLNTDLFKITFSKNFIRYIESTIYQNDYIPALPYDFLEEFEDKGKILELKNYLRN